mgnify:CR=1 FL=1
MDLNETFFFLVDNDNGFDNQLLADRCELICKNYTKKILTNFLRSERLQFKQKQGDFSIDELLSEIEKTL